MSDNAATPAASAENGGAQQAAPIATPAAAPDAGAPAPVTPSGWKEQLSTDMQNSPLVKKFENTKDGMQKAFEAHSNLEHLLGHEKVPIPKGVDDVEGWNRFSKAMGIPDAAEGYGLADANIPDNMRDLTLNKNKFAEIAHAHKLTPEQAKGLWEVYQQENISAYNKAVEAHQKTMDGVVNELRAKWGDAYQSNVELGQMVINKFSTDQEMNDYLTATLTKDPRGVEFLAKLGDQFAENKISGFQITRFSLSPEMAKEEYMKIIRDPNHAYNSDKATPQEHKEAVDYVNNLIAVSSRI